MGLIEEETEFGQTGGNIQRLGRGGKGPKGTSLRHRKLGAALE